MFENLDVCGIMFILFVITALLNYYCRYLEDNSKKPILQRILSILCLITCILSLPIIIILYPIYRLYAKKEMQLYQKEESIIQQRLQDIDRREIDELKRENDRLNSELDTMYQNGYAKGRSWEESGYRNGFRDGYWEGFDFCLMHAALAPDDRKKLQSEVPGNIIALVQQHKLDTEIYEDKF